MQYIWMLCFKYVRFQPCRILFIKSKIWKYFFLHLNTYLFLCVFCSLSNTVRNRCKSYKFSQECSFTNIRPRHRLTTHQEMENVEKIGKQEKQHTLLFFWSTFFVPIKRWVDKDNVIKMINHHLSSMKDISPPPVLPPLKKKSCHALKFYIIYFISL